MVGYILYIYIFFYLIIHKINPSPTCQKTVSQTESFVEHADRFWHRNCFNCFSCLISLKDAPMVDVKGRPCCEKCLFAQEGKKTVAPSFGSVSSDSSTESFYIRPRLPVNKELFTPPSSRTPSPPKQQQKVSQRPCQGCHALLGVGNKKLKVQLSSGSYAWFHKTCFVCCECRLSFNDGDCVTDGELFYHNQCDPKKNKQAPLSLPQCAECCLTIDTDACRFNGVMYHLKCFRCMDCKVSISPTQPVFIEKGLRYCTKCIDKPKQVVPTVVEEKVTHQEPQLPISLIPRQQRTLKLGGSKTCPRCKQSISIMDDTPGPLTTRWHKKCLCCYKCNKQLDSGAKVCPGTKGEAVVYCRTCVIVSDLLQLTFLTMTHLLL
jgi:hypothetical protein